MPYCSVKLPVELARRYGLSTGSEIEAVAHSQGLLLRRAPDHLAKVYVEVTSHCNLACEMCVRNAWNEPLGRMPLDLFRRLVVQLSGFPSPHHPDVRLLRRAAVSIPIFLP